MKMAEKWQKNINIKDNPFILPGVAFFVALCWPHARFPIYGDDIGYMQIAQEGDLLGFVLSRYSEWSSRALIEFVMLVVGRRWSYFIVSNIAIFCLLYYFLVKTFVDKPDRKACWICVFFIFMYPLWHMGSAGYMATMLNYLWPLTFGVIAGYGMKKSLLDQKIHIWEYPIYISALLFASNLEQMNILLLGLLVLLSAYSLAVKRKVDFYLLSQLLVVVAMLIFILQCPGNDVRFSSEIIRWFPDYATLGIMERFQLGYAFVLSHFILNPNLVFFVFCLLLYIAVHTRYTDKSYRAIAAIPLGSSALFCIWGVANLSSENRLSSFGQNAGQVANALNYHLLYFWLPMVLLGFVVLCVLSALYLAFRDDKWKSWLCVAIVLLGLGSALIMGFSPTIWASKSRTLIFAYFAFISCMLLLYGKICTDGFRHENLLFAVCCFLGICSSYVSSVILA